VIILHKSSLSSFCFSFNDPPAWGGTWLWWILKERRTLAGYEAMCG